MRVWVVAVVYSIAFLGGMVTLWAFEALGVMSYFQGRIDSLFVVLMFMVLAAMCTFSVIYGLASGTALKWQYWLFTTLAMAFLVWAIPEAITAGYVTVFEGFTVAVLLVFTGGFLACLRRDVLATPSQLKT